MSDKKPPRSTDDLLDWFTVSYRTIYLAVGGVVLIGALVVGAVVGAVATRLVAPRLDPLPTIPPDSLIVLPVVGISIGLLATVIASVVGALLADRSARRVPLGEVLRVAE